uniref:DNA/RNA helicase, superfamily II n=1 Tax=Desulfovibrio sp. U5L TaxID=596152 RepID=I2Q4G5_9BACT
MTNKFFEDVRENGVSTSVTGAAEEMIDAAGMYKNGFYALFLKNDKFQQIAMRVYEEGALVFGKFKMDLKNAGVPLKDIKEIEKLLKSENKRINASKSSKSGPLLHLAPLLGDDSISASLVLPKQYQIDSFGQVLTMGNNPQMVSQCPIIIASKMKNINDKSVHLKIGWKNNSRWQYITVSKELVARTQDISKLAGYDFPVTSLNASLLVGYLSAFENLNSSNIPEIPVTYKMGWHNNGSCFLWGSHVITKETDFEKVATGDVKCENIDNQTIIFKGRDVYDEEVVRGLSSKGQYKSWIEIANSIFQYHDVRFSFYVSFLPPFLEILNSNNFTVDLSGNSSKGKTTTLKLAASVWGNPDATSDSIVNTWATTVTSVERTAEIMSNLPIFLDDTKLAGNVKDNKQTASALISNVLYAIASGRGKSRGKLIGVDHTSSFKTILFSTGEGPATSLTDNEGAKGRTVSLLGNPFCKDDADMSKFVSTIEEGFKSNYGHAGPRVVKFIMNHETEHELWRQAYAEVCDRLMTKAGSSSIAMRLAKDIAAVVTIIPMVHAALPELTREYPIDAMIDHIWSKVTSERTLPDKNIEILKDLYDYAVLNPLRFFHGPSSQGQPVPQGGYEGCIYGEPDWKFIGFSAGIYNKITGSYKLTFRDVALKNGWFDLNKSGEGYQKQVCMGTKKVNLYCIKKTAFEEAFGYLLEGESSNDVD